MNLPEPAHKDPDQLRGQYEKLKRQYENLLKLHRVTNVIHSTLDPKDALYLIVREAVQLVGASSGSVSLVNPNTEFLEIQAGHGLPKEVMQLKLKAGEGVTGWVVQNGCPARVGNVHEDPRYVMVRDNIQSELAAPLEVNGEIRGALNVDSDQLDAFSEEDQKTLLSLASEAATVIHKTWLYEQIRIKARWLESLVSVSQKINSTLNCEEALETITRECRALIDAKMCSLRLLDDTGEWLDLKACDGAGEAYLSKPRIQTSDSFLGSVVRLKKPLQIANVQTTSQYQNTEIARQEGLISLLSVPLIFQDQSIGALNVYLDRLHRFSNEEIRILCALAELSATAIEKARLYERVVDVEEHLRKNEKLSALGLLAAEVAHEIRNPLTVMKMLFHSLELEFPADDPRSQDVEIITEKMDHLNKVVQQTLDLARGWEPNPEWVDVNELILDLGLLTRHKFNQQKVKLVMDLGPDLPKVWADATQLEQVFLNLTLNAVEAMPDGGNLTITSRIGINQPSDKIRAPRKHSAADTQLFSPHVIIEFTDTGEGIREDQRGELFKSWVLTSKSKGTGIGLAIVGRIIEAHKGIIEADSDFGKGATFRIRLPIRPKSENKSSDQR